MPLKIDNEFKNLIPPLTPEEYQQLEKSLKEEGCRDSLITWGETIIDGHNRFEICSKNGIHFDTNEHEFDSREDAIEWIIRNQFGRRNLPLYERGKLALKLEDVIREKASKNQKTSTGGSNPQLLLNSSKAGNSIEPIHTRAELAKAAGVSEDTIAKIKVIEEKATPEQKKDLADGVKKINRVYRELHPKSTEPKTTEDEPVCTICGIKKPSSEFHKGRGVCRICNSYLRSEEKPEEARQKIRSMSGNVVDGVDLILESMKAEKASETDTKTIYNQVIADLMAIVNTFNIDINRFIYAGQALRGNYSLRELVGKAISNLESIKNLMEA